MELIFTIPHVFNPETSSRENAAVLRISLEYLIALNVDYLQRHPETPRLRDSHVVYHRTHEWETIPAVLLRGYGDCKSLTAWRIAEYRVMGHDARPVFRNRPRRDGFKNYHILIQLPGLVHEDPSKEKGMSDTEVGGEKRLPLAMVLKARALAGDD